MRAFGVASRCESSRRPRREAARIGDAHYPGPASVSEVEQYRVEIGRIAVEHGRDPASIETIVAAPYDRPLDIDLCHRYAAAGVAEIIISLPQPSHDGSVIRATLETFHGDVLEGIESD